MTGARRRPPPPPWCPVAPPSTWQRAAPIVVLIGLVVFGVMTMHTVTAGSPHAQSTAGTPDAGAQSSMSHAAMAGGAGAATGAPHGTATAMSTAAPDRPDTQASGDHCEMMGHACEFIRADNPPPALAVLLVLAWGFVAAPVLTGRWAAVVRRPGRPPPWAMPTHLELSVIRC